MNRGVQIWELDPAIAVAYEAAFLKHMPRRPMRRMTQGIDLMQRETHG